MELCLRPVSVWNLSAVKLQENQAETRPIQAIDPGTDFAKTQLNRFLRESFGDLVSIMADLADAHLEIESAEIGEWYAPPKTKEWRQFPEPPIFRMIIRASQCD